MAIIQLADEALLRQMPGIFTVKEVAADKSYFSFVNETLADMIGYADPDKLIGLSDCDAKCDEIADNCEVFYEHDRQVMTGKTLKTLDIYPYQSDNIFGILAIKKPLRDQENQIQGVLCQGYPLSKNSIDSIIAMIPDFLTFHNKITQVSATTYQIVEDLDFFNLTKKELECFFYVLRGKSAKEIAGILCRSLKTIHTHIENIKIKCQIHKKSEFFDLAYAYGLLTILPARFVQNAQYFTNLVN